MHRRDFLMTSARVLTLVAATPHGLAALAGGAGWPRTVAAMAPGATRVVGPAPGGMVISIDPRIELHYVVLLLSDFRGPEGFPAPVLTSLEFPYRDDVEARFAPFRGHPAVSLYAGMARRRFWLGHPVTAMLHLSGPPELAEVDRVDDFTTGMAGGRPALDDFLAHMRQFAADSGFMEWFGEGGDARRRIVESCRDRIDRDYAADLAAYYGELLDSYPLVVAPLAHSGGFGPRVRRADGRYQAFAVIGPKEVDEGRPTFGSPDELRALLWHEFSHSHVNHLTDRHIDRLRGPVAVLQAHAREEVERYVPWDIHVGDWVSEHVVRGATTRLAYREVGTAAGDRALRREVTEFPYVGEVADRLEEYERSRDRYPDLASFYPQVVRLFESLADRHER